MPPRHLVRLFPIDQGQQIDHMIENSPPPWRLHTQIEWLDMLKLETSLSLASRSSFSWTVLGLSFGGCKRKNLPCLSMRRPLCALRIV